MGSGNRIAMADLRSALESAGHGDVRTVLASGNAVFDSPGSSTDVTTALEQLLSERFGYSARVIVVPIDVIQAAVDAFPFEESDDQQPYVVFGSTPRVLDDLAEAAPSDEADRLERVGEVLFWSVAKGHTLDSPFGKLLAKRQKTDVVTTRNLRTLRKILAAA